MSKHLPAHFISAAEAYLTGDREIEVRALSFNDIARIASGEAPLNFNAFQADDDGHLVPVVVTVETFRGDRAKVNTTYAIDPSTGHLDRSNPVGARLTVHIGDADGVGEARGYLFTTKAAEKATTAEDARSTRKSLFLPLDSDVPSDESTGKVSTKPLAAFHGSKVTASFVVEGISPSALEAKIRTFILDIQFGGSQSSAVNIETEPVRDQRVDVFDPISGAPIALNILVAEIDLLPESGYGFDVRPVMDMTGVLIGR